MREGKVGLVGAFPLLRRLADTSKPVCSRLVRRYIAEEAEICVCGENARSKDAFEKFVLGILPANASCVSNHSAAFSIYAPQTHHIIQANPHRERLWRLKFVQCKGCNTVWDALQHAPFGMQKVSYDFENDIPIVPEDIEEQILHGRTNSYNMLFANNYPTDKEIDQLDATLEFMQHQHRIGWEFANYPQIKVWKNDVAMTRQRKRKSSHAWWNLLFNAIVFSFCLLQS